jgi:phage N-6-adenine-methyltransferase
MFDRKDKSYDKDSLQTPQYLFDWLNDMYEFDVDVAASDKHHMCDRYITKEQDALSMERWCDIGGTAFINPPYSTTNTPADGRIGFIDLFIQNAIFQYTHNGIISVLVIPELNGEKRSTMICRHARKIMHFDRRVSFIHPLTGKPQNGNNRGTMVVEIGPDTRGLSLTQHTCHNLKEIINDYS